MIKGHQIEKKLEIEKFEKIVANYSEDDIHTTKHTFFRLKEKDRKIFKEQIITDHLLSRRPKLVGIQNNGCHAVYYKYDKKTLKIILDIKNDKIDIVTFYIIDNYQVPKL